MKKRSLLIKTEAMVTGVEQIKKDALHKPSVTPVLEESDILNVTENQKMRGESELELINGRSSQMTILPPI